MSKKSTKYGNEMAGFYELCENIVKATDKLNEALTISHKAGVETDFYVTDPDKTGVLVDTCRSNIESYGTGQLLVACPSFDGDSIPETDYGQTDEEDEL